VVAAAVVAAAVPNKEIGMIEELAVEAAEAVQDTKEVRKDVVVEEDHLIKILIVEEVTLKEKMATLDLD
jgi:hypothetical protein